MKRAHRQPTTVYAPVSLHKLKAIHEATRPGARVIPAAARAAEVVNSGRVEAEAGEDEG